MHAPIEFDAEIEDAFQRELHAMLERRIMMPVACSPSRTAVSGLIQAQRRRLSIQRSAKRSYETLSGFSEPTEPHDDDGRYDSELARLNRWSPSIAETNAIPGLSAELLL